MKGLRIFKNLVLAQFVLTVFGFSLVFYELQKLNGRERELIKRYTPMVNGMRETVGLKPVSSFNSIEELSDAFFQTFGSLFVSMQNPAGDQQGKE